MAWLREVSPLRSADLSLRGLPGPDPDADRLGRGRPHGPAA